MNPRKYTQGGYVLPVKMEFPTLAEFGDVRVIDSTGRLIKRFRSVGLARAMVARLNNPVPVPWTRHIHGYGWTCSKCGYHGKNDTGMRIHERRGCPREKP